MEAVEQPVDDAIAVVSLDGELDAADLAWSEQIGAAIDSGKSQVVVDMLNVTFVDSSVVRELVLAHKRVMADGGWVRIVYTHHLITRVFEICGLAAIFPQYPTVDAALRRGRKEG